MAVNTTTRTDANSRSLADDLSQFHNKAQIELPTFLIIGAARSGTSTLYHLLQSSPDVYLRSSKRPEPHFFLKSDEYAKGFSWYLQRYFSNCRGRPARGEASTSYLCHEFVAQRIRIHLPDIKLIAILRNPVDRAYSNYWHSVKYGHETLTFDDAIENESQRQAEQTDALMREIQPFSYIERGFYAKQLKNYLKHVSSEQMLVVLLEDIVQRPSSALNKIARFLDIRPMRETRAPKNTHNASTPQNVRMTTETRRRLVELFRDDVNQLSQLLNRDLNGWLR